MMVKKRVFWSVVLLVALLIFVSVAAWRQTTRLRLPCMTFRGGALVAELEGASGINEITWDGAGLANGPYLYVMVVTAGEDTYTAKGTVFINK